jgi:omega-hydroxy-beta-dihydromenaquinone-9 sulfotransferase
VSRLYLNMTAASWRQLRRNWKLPFNSMLAWQTAVPGTMFSALAGVQKVLSRAQLAKANFGDAIVVLGYWRSGTTLLHELLCLDTRYTYPTTHACMNPHHFMLTEAAALSRGGASMKRPMDEMEVRSASPQEDEFAFLSLGARSPYEALIMPGILREALKLTDPRDLSPQDEKRWREIFVNFLGGVSVRGMGRPMILKSPTHGARVSTLRELLPDARYILIARDPMTNFESVVRMWKKMFESYAIGPLISDDEIREAVLEDRPRFEAKLASATSDLSPNRYAAIAYESLVANPAGIIEQLYDQLELGDFEPMRDVLGAEMQRRRGYKAKGSLPSPPWQARIEQEWAELLLRHTALVNSASTAKAAPEP